MNLFSFIKSKLSIVDVVNEYTNLKRAGVYYKANCPFHHEKTASFTVSPGREIFYCFGCHVHGDIISFIARIENCSPLEAVRHLADRYHIEIPEELAHERGFKAAQKEDYTGLCAKVAAWAHKQLQLNLTILNYLKSRSISQESINSFLLGFFPHGSRAIKQFVNAMAEQNILVADLVEANILVEGNHGLYSPFEDRVLFPICDHLGRFSGFGGRTYKADDTRAKYYNSKESAFFSKGSLLFGFNNAKNHLRETEKVFLVEGYTDCIAMVQHGYQNTVATLGTACTLEHLRQLARYVSHVYVLYDGDMAGQQAIIRLAQLSWQCDMELFAITLPERDDPASLLAHGDSLEPYIAKAQDIFSFYIGSFSKNFSTQSLAEKLHASDRIIEILKNVTNPLKQDILIQKAAQSLGIPVTSLKREVCKSIVHRSSEPPKSSGLTDSQPNKLEKKIFFALINNIQLVNGEREEYLFKYFQEPLCGILLRLKKELASNPDLDFSRFFEMLDDENQKIVAKIMMEQEDTISKETFDALVEQYQRRHWKLVAHEIAERLNQAKRNNDTELERELLEKFFEMKKRLLERSVG